MQLSDLQIDALREVINIGVGYAASSLNELIGAHVRLTVPEIAVLDFQEAMVRLAVPGCNSLSTVQLQFSGSIKGDVALIFPSDSAVKLVSLLTGEEGGDSDVDGIRAATLEEAGNILLNGVVGSVSNLLHEDISFSVPYYSEGALPQGLGGEGVVHVIFARARFNMDEHEIQGEILLFLGVGYLEALVLAIDQYIAQSV
jgi:chemotaxis protein CheC